MSLVDGPWGSDPAFFIIWSRFRQLRQYLSCGLDEDRLLDYASTGSPGHAWAIHLLVDSAQEIGFSWVGPGPPPSVACDDWPRPALLKCHLASLAG